MSALTKKLRSKFLGDKEYAHTYMESAVDSRIAMQIKALRDQNEWSQERLGAETGMKQERISVLESVNYSSWSIATLRKLARAYDLVLNVSFEEFDTELSKIDSLGNGKLNRVPREKDLQRALPSHAPVVAKETSFEYFVAGTVRGALRQSDETASDKYCLPELVTQTERRTYATN